MFASFSKLVALHLIEKDILMLFPSLHLRSECAATCVGDHTHTSSPCVCGVRVSALWVCPARGAEGCAREQMVVAGQEGGRAQRQRAQRERCRSCGLGWVRTSKILMQGFSSSLEQTLHQSSGRKSCTHSTMLVENGRQPVAGLLFKYFTQANCKHAVPTWIYFGHGCMTISWCLSILLHYYSSFSLCSGNTMDILA